MGHDLYRMMRAGMPADWSEGERLVALIIADSCSDSTRRGYISNEQLCAETGYTPRGVSNVLTKLARRGFELRAIHGYDKRGRPVYAARGHRTDYLVPILPPREKVAPQCELTEGRTDVPPKKGRTPVLERSHVRVERSHAGATPTPFTPYNPLTEAPVITPSVEVSSAGNGAASRLPIEQAAWVALWEGARHAG